MSGKGGRRRRTRHVDVRQDEVKVLVAVPEELEGRGAGAHGRDCVAVWWLFSRGKGRGMSREARATGGRPARGEPNGDGDALALQSAAPNCRRGRRRGRAIALGDGARGQGASLHRLVAFGWAWRWSERGARAGGGRRARPLSCSLSALSPNAPRYPALTSIASMSLRHSTSSSTTSTLSPAGNDAVNACDGGTSGGPSSSTIAALCLAPSLFFLSLSVSASAC